jgi:hypothetical protein
MTTPVSSPSAYSSEQNVRRSECGVIWELRVSDQDVPALRLERVVDEPCAVYRLHNRPHPPVMLRREAIGQTAQTIRVERRGQLTDELALIRDQTDVNALATEIQPNMQHDVQGLLLGRSSVTTRTCHRRGPPSSHSRAGVSLGAMQACA